MTRPGDELELGALSAAADSTSEPSMSSIGTAYDGTTRSHTIRGRAESTTTSPPSKARMRFAVGCDRSSGSAANMC